MNINMALYKIAKIVRALWLAERRVCMRLCKHGSDVKMFAFSALVTQARIWKSFWVQNSTRLLYLPIPSSAETWKIFTNKLCQFFSPKPQKSWKASFCKQTLITRARLRVQDFGTGKNFCFNQCHNKEFLSFFLGKVIFIKAIENFFLCLHSLI